MLPLRPWAVVVNPPRPTIWRWPERRSWSSHSPVQQPSADQRFSVQSTTHLSGPVPGVCIGAVDCSRFGGQLAGMVSGGWFVWGRIKRLIDFPCIIARIDMKLWYPLNKPGETEFLDRGCEIFRLGKTQFLSHPKTLRRYKLCINKD